MIKYLRAAHIASIRIWNNWRIIANGDKYLRVLYELDTWARNRIKYEELSEGYEMALRDMREKMMEICADNGVSPMDYD